MTRNSRLLKQKQIHRTGATKVDRVLGIRGGNEINSIFPLCVSYFCRLSLEEISNRVEAKQGRAVPFRIPWHMFDTRMRLIVGKRLFLGFLA